jgi:Galactose-3-O-sulfotransferase
MHVSRTSHVSRASNDIERAPEDRALIFVHPPKTAGSTLSRIMDWEYNPLEVCNIDGRFYYWSFQRISAWPKERLAKIRLFKGHMPFGLHEFVPRPATYITVLRDPIKRTLSEYYYRQHRRTHPIADRDAKRLSLEEYVASVPYNNPQTKAIAGVDHPCRYHLLSVVPSHHIYSGPCTAETLAVAKDNLYRHFSLIGLTERFEETLALAKLLFGWKISCYTSIQQGPGRPKKTEISARARGLIAEYNKFDMELYSFGVSLFERAIAERAEHVWRELEGIRRARNPNALRAMYHRSASVIRRHLIRLHCAV